jgi:hypothetical protein
MNFEGNWTPEPPASGLALVFFGCSMTGGIVLATGIADQNRNKRYFWHDKS